MYNYRLLFVEKAYVLPSLPPSFPFSLRLSLFLFSPLSFSLPFSLSPLLPSLNLLGRAEFEHLEEGSNIF